MVLFTSSFCASVSEDSCVVICIEPSNKIASAVLGTSVGNEDGALVGLRVEVGRCEYEGAEVGLRVGTVVGARVGFADGGRVYATTIVSDDTEELAVTISLAVMFTPVMFELALMSSLVRLPLVAAEARADANSSVRLAALPA